LKLALLSFLCIYPHFRRLLMVRIQNCFTTSTYVALVTVAAGAFFSAAAQFAVQEFGRGYWLYGDHDTCYFNSRCYTPLFVDLPINNILSHIPYYVCGYLVLAHVAIWETRISAHPNAENRPDLGVFYGLAWAVVCEGVGSTCYHICPSPVMFQFDTAMMYVITFLSSICLNDLDGGAQVPPESLMLLLVVPMWLVSFAGTWVDYVLAADSYIFFMSYACIVVLWTCVLLVLARHIFPTTHKISRGLIVLRVLVLIILTLMLGPREIRKHKAGGTSNLLLGTSLMVMMLTVTRQVFRHDNLGAPFHQSRMSFIFFAQLMQKMVARFGFFGIFLAICCVGLHFFNDRQSDYEKTPSQSRDMNGPCVFLGFFDNHDVWHLMSAIALSVWVLFLLDIRIRIWKRQLPSNTGSEHAISQIWSQPTHTTQPTTQPHVERRVTVVWFCLFGVRKEYGFVISYNVCRTAAEHDGLPAAAPNIRGTSSC